MFKKLIILLSVFAIANNLSCAVAGIDEQSIADKDRAENSKLLFEILNEPYGIHIDNVH